MESMGIVGTDSRLFRPVVMKILLGKDLDKKEIAS